MKAEKKQKKKNSFATKKIGLPLVLKEKVEKTSHEKMLEDIECWVDVGMVKEVCVGLWRQPTRDQGQGNYFGNSSLLNGQPLILY